MVIGADHNSDGFDEIYRNKRYCDELSNFPLIFFDATIQANPRNKRGICVKTVDFRKEMDFSRIVLKALLVLVLMSSWVIHAAGLGKLTVGSYLGQPFKAEIALVSVTDQEAASLSAGVASSEAFRKAGLNYLPYHSSLSVSVEQRIDGQPYLLVTSPQVVNEPFINLLVELNSSSGRLLRDYTVLLDPAKAQAAGTAVPARGQIDGPAEGSDDSPRGASAQTGSSDQAGKTYGPVNHGDTLTKIARQVSPGNVDLNQMLVALYRANRDAFLQKNMNLLKVGAILRIPDQSVIAAITPQTATREVSIQTERWNNYRRNIADMATGVPGSNEIRRSHTGKITAISEKLTTTGASQPEEVLILSKGELLDSDPQSNKQDDNHSAQQYLRMMEEDAIAKARALAEANERVAILEQNIAKLQRLLELKNTTEDTRIPVAQDRVPIDDEVYSGARSAMALAANSAPQPMEDLAIPEFTIPAQPVSSELLPNAIERPEDSTSEKFSMFDTFSALTADYGGLLGGTLAALLAIWLAASIARRKSEQADDFDDMASYSHLGNEAGRVSAAFAETGFEPDNQQKMHTGMDQSALKLHDDHHEHARSEFENRVEESLSKDGDGYPGENAADTLLSLESDWAPETSSLSDEATQLDTSLGGMRPDPVSPAEEDAGKLEDHSGEAEWSFPDYGMDLDIQRNDDHAEEKIGQHDTLIEDAHGGDSQRDIADVGSADTDHGLRGKSLREPDLTHIDLNLGDESSSTTAEDYPVDEDLQWREVATKIDLAKAYLEMDDKEGAKEILEEVLAEGDSEQQAKARSMLDGMN
ncbi:pilus assembly protein FimV [Nitrosomonas halophila]|uniref:Pilus assembly protein FimV n=1 Tax=Nitrosomonas halophila TaxID=44576 RepID=A0A1H3F424_9PROT|nr:pilus assembly protein FimV [Nitrosomonas halophila]